MAGTAEEIAALLRAQIDEGEYEPGDRLPTIEELVDEHGVGRQTARSALNLLKGQGVAEYLGGRGGTVVRRRPVQRMVRSRGMERDNLGYYSGANVQHWRLVAGTQTEVTTERTPADIAQWLGIEAGTEAVVRRRLNGDPNVDVYRQLTDSWLHPEAVAALPMLAGDSGLGGIYDRIEEWTGQPIEWDEEVMGATPTPKEAKDLLLPKGVSLLRVIRTSAIKRDGRTLIVEVNDIRMSAELFSVRYPMTRQGDAVWPVRPATKDFYTAPSP
jgi:GntR family transcriptional regulator